MWVTTSCGPSGATTEGTSARYLRIARQQELVLQKIEQLRAGFINEQLIARDVGKIQLRKACRCIFCRNVRTLVRRSHRVVEVGDDLVRAVGRDLGGDLGEVLPDHLVRREAAEHRVRFDAVVAQLEGVERADDPVEGGEVELGAGRVGAQPGLAELEARPDRELGECGAAAVDLLEIAVDVEARHRHHAVLADQVPLVGGEVLGVREPGVLEVEVLGEEQRGQSDFHGPCAGRTHGAARGGVRAAGVPGELAVDVAVGGKGGHGARVAQVPSAGSVTRRRRTAISRPARDRGAGGAPRTGPGA